MTAPIGQWRCAGASVTGRSHERDGLGCQDFWSVCRSATEKPPILAACVCDGAGSAKHAREGAELVSSFLARWLVTNFARTLDEPAEALFEAFSAVREALTHIADKSGSSLGDYACTVVAIAATEDGQWVAWHLGDGGIISQFGASIGVLSAPTKGEFANVTHFITDHDACAMARGCSSRNCSDERPLAFVLFTDGVELSLFERKTGAVAPAVSKMLCWHDLANEEEVGNAVKQNLEEIFKVLTGDDCTLVLLRLVEESLSNDSSVACNGDRKQ